MLNCKALTVLEKQNIGPVAQLATRPNVPKHLFGTGGECVFDIMFVVYVLKDEDGKLYKGVTGNLERRLKAHQRGHTVTTSRMCNVKVVYSENFDTFIEARSREVYFKTAAGRRFLKSKILDP